MDSLHVLLTIATIGSTAMWLQYVHWYRATAKLCDNAQAKWKACLLESHEARMIAIELWCTSDTWSMTREREHEIGKLIGEWMEDQPKG